MEDNYIACSNATRQELTKRLPEQRKAPTGAGLGRVPIQGDHPEPSVRDGGADHRRLLRRRDSHLYVTLRRTSSFVRNISFRDLEFSLEDIMSTMRSMYANLFSHSSSTRSVAGRGVAMHVYVQGGLNGITCSIWSPTKGLAQVRPQPPEEQQQGVNEGVTRRRRRRDQVFSAHIRDSQRRRAPSTTTAAGQQRRC